MQTLIDENMRAALVDWIVEVTDEYLVQTNTLFLAVHIFDQVLTRVPIVPSQLHVLGVACVVVASKLEEVQVRVYVCRICMHFTYTVYFYFLRRLLFVASVHGESR